VKQKHRACALAAGERRRSSPPPGRSPRCCAHRDLVWVDNLAGVHVEVPPAGWKRTDAVRVGVELDRDLARQVDLGVRGSSARSDQGITRARADVVVESTSAKPKPNMPTATIDRRVSMRRLPASRSLMARSVITV